MVHGYSNNVVKRCKTCRYNYIKAMNLLINSLVTPLQINHYLTIAMEQAYLSDTKPISPEIIQSVLVPDLDGIEARLARNGYNLQALCEILNSRPSEVKSYLLANNTNKNAEFSKKFINWE